jgi:hypothetical protein
MFSYENEEELVMPELPLDARNLTKDMLLGEQKKKPA